MMGEINLQDRHAFTIGVGYIDVPTEKLLPAQQVEFTFDQLAPWAGIRFSITIGSPFASAEGIRFYNTDETGARFL